MDMTRVETAKISGAALDWAVAMCEGYKPEDICISGNHLYRYLRDLDGNPTSNYTTGPALFYSRMWETGGPVIERLEGFTMKTWLDSGSRSRCEAHLHTYEGNWVAFGPTPLIAAMRCYVVSKLGDTVEVPSQLIQE